MESTNGLRCPPGSKCDSQFVRKFVGLASGVASDVYVIFSYAEVMCSVPKRSRIRREFASYGNIQSMGVPGK